MSQWEQTFYIHKMNNKLKDELHIQGIKRIVIEETAYRGGGKKEKNQ